MRPLPVVEFARLCGGELSGEPGGEVLGFALDSRTVEPGQLFVAIRGANFDGHDYVRQAIELGAVATLAERAVPGPHVRVGSLVEALARFGRARRDGFRGPVVGVTGSNGKTTTKEFLASALTAHGLVLKSPANRNTEYTSPLVWAELDGQASAVIEMAMRGHGQIAHLAAVSCPTVGVITGIGTAHVETVGSREGIMRAKTELFAALPEDGVSVCWREDDFFPELSERARGRLRTFGFSLEAECRVVGYRALSWDSCAIKLALNGESFDLVLPTVGRHQALNAAAALLGAESCGVRASHAAALLDKAELPPMRMEARRANGAVLLVDTYNASPDSTVAAIRTLAEAPASGRRLAVLGEMRELGDFTESGHRLVGRALAEADLDGAFLTGGPTRFIADEALRAGYPPSRLSSEETLDLDRIRAWLGQIRADDIVLIKGSRALGLERALPREGV